MREMIRDSLHTWLMTMLLSVWALFMLRFATGVPLHMGPVLAILCLWTVLTAAADRLARGAGVAVLLLAALALTFWAFEGAPLVEYTAAMYTGGETALSPAGDAVVLLQLAAFACGAMYACRGFWPRAVLSALWTGYWVRSALRELELPGIALAAMLPVLLFTLAEGIHRFRSRGDGRGFAPLAPVLLPLFTAVGALTLLLPAPPEPYGYPVLSAIAEKVEEMYDSAVTELFYRREGDEQFSLPVAGYSDDGEVGQGVSGGYPGGALYVRVRHSPGEALYLAGSSLDTFDGRAWTSGIAGDGEGLLDWNADTAERIYALWRFRQRDRTRAVTDYFRSTSVHLSYRGLRTRTLFTPSNAMYIAADPRRFPWSSGPGKVLFDYLQTEDADCRVYYLDQNRRHLPELIRGSEGYAYDGKSDLLWRTVFADYRPELELTLDIFDTARELEPALERRQALIYGTYLDVPGDISREARALALEITRDCGSAYEKLQAISAYLQDNYRYTTEPTPVPEGADFLDHVLFGPGEGYCTWYATAATLLARCAGVPARYVQGYRVSPEAGVLTAVEERDSHAWCEGYVPGFGWVTVEATPGFSAAGAGWGDGDGAEAAAEEIPAEEEAVGSSTAEEESGRGLHAAGGYLAATALLLLAAGTAAALLRRQRMRREYRAASWSGKVLLDLESFLRAPVRREYRRQSGESLRQYLARLRWSLHLDPERMEDMTALYEQVLFAGREPTEEEWRESRAFLAMLQKLRRRQSRTNHR